MTVLATLALATALACGGTTIAGCGGGSSGSNNPGQDSGTGDSSADTGKPDTGGGGQDSGADTNVGQDTGVVDTGTADTFQLPACPTPTLAPPSGADPGSVTITDTGLPASAFIYYTTDLTNPSTSSPVYSGPIQVTTDTTIRAFADDPTGKACGPSAVVSGVYTVTPFDGGGLPPVTFETQSSTAHNDFLLGLSDSPAPGSPTICYTEDGTVPTCSAGACTGTSQTYNSANRVPVNGTITDVTTGQVTIHAIACEAGYADSIDQNQVYTLQSADPTIAGIVAGDQPFNANGLAVTLATSTQSSISPPNQSNIGFSFTGAPACVNGNTGTPTPINLSTSGAGAAKITQTNGTIEFQACKAGYLPSGVITTAYTFTLNSPTITGGTFFVRPTLTTGTTAGPGVVVDGKNGVGNDTVCGTTGGAAPTCAAGGGCGTAATEDVVTNLKPGNATSATTNIKVIACPTAGALPINASITANADFTLQLSQPFLSTNDTFANPANGPGWDSTTDGLPVTGFSIPNQASTSAPFPYGDTCGASPCTWQANQVQGPATACDEFDTSGKCISYFASNYYCWSVTGAAACGCANPVTAGGAPVEQVALPAGSGTSAGKTLSLISCQTAAPAPAILWAPSAVTNVVVSGPGQAVSPGVSAPEQTPYTTQATVTLTNNDPLPSNVCFTYASPAVTPTCTVAGACNLNCSATNCTAGGVSLGGNADSPADNVYTLLPGSSDATGSATGTKYASAPGTYDKTSGTRTGQANGGLVQKDGFVLTAVACNATKTASTPKPQTYNFAMAEPDISSLAAYSSGKYGDLDSTTTIGAGTAVYVTSGSNYDSTGVATTPTVASATGNSVTCGGALTNLQAVTFKGTTLTDVWDVGGVQKPTQLLAPTTGTTWALDVIGCGQSTTLQTSSAQRPVTYNLAASTPLISTDQDTQVNLHLNTSSGTCSSTAATCGLAANPPCCTCDDSGTSATTGLPVCCSVQHTAQGGGTFSCASATTWENAFHVQVTSATPGTSLCVSTVAPPTCNAAGQCQGATNQASPVNLTVNTANTTVYALGCAANLPESTQAAQSTFAIDTTPAQLVSTGGSCGANPFIQLTTDPANSATVSTSDISGGGPSANTCICYTTDGTPTGTCTATPAGTCTKQPGSTATCFLAYNGSTATNGSYQHPAQSQLPLSTTTTVNFTTCSSGFVPATGSPVFSTSPYRETITVDGNMSEWDQNTFATTSNTNDDSIVGNLDERGGYGNPTLFFGNQRFPLDENTGNIGTFTYDNTNLYFGFSNVPNVPPSEGPTYQNTPGFFATGQCCNAAGPNCAGGACYPAAATWLTIYIGSGVAGGATAEIPSAGPGDDEVSRSLPAAAGIRYALSWQSTTQTAPTAWTWTPGAPGSWGAGSFTAKAASSASGVVELSVPSASLGITATSQVTVLAAVVADTGDAANGSNQLLFWPNGKYNGTAGTSTRRNSYSNYWSVNLASCNPPSTGITSN